MEKLKKQFDKLQKIYGAKDLMSVYGNGCQNEPELMLVFMNPTSRNIATNKSWKGIRAQWLGTKDVWKFLTKCALFDNNLFDKISKMKPVDWTPEFVKKCTKMWLIIVCILPIWLNVPKMTQGLYLIKYSLNIKRY